ncbi:alpha/beta fold hydrolase [Cohnella pontilimi]|uniref:Alpha/beta fold hydrolase n=1 Tax=Cohnella pontilimi TaxID=2564100 RepID=A0A4U0FER5_9BACL|nr:alpha/beta fold hydrolase [Cohnella pontilimi]TJY42824.1 alpha/beta fold hydrolase [Cohnella pontilimi]
MRTLEFILIAINVLSLLLSNGKHSKNVWLGTAGANAAVLILHGIVEGFRYQMAFSYLFVGLLAIYALIKSSTKFCAVKTPRLIKAVTLLFSIVILAISFFLTYALPVFALPKPTGSYTVGVKYVHLVDEKRNDPFLDKTPTKRELMVKVYYPAKKENSKPYARYFRGDQEQIRAFTEFYQGLPSFVLDHLKLVKTHSKEDLALSDQQAKYPVILFSHGAGASMEVQAALSEDLASHGYVVVAIDHTYISAMTAFPDRIVHHSDAATDFSEGDPGEVLTKIMFDDSKFVINELGDMNAGRMESMFKGKLDMDHIGAIGHSVGGAVAYNLAINEPRVKAAVNLDGRVFVTPKLDSVPMAPYLMVANTYNHLQSIEKRESLLQKYDDMPQLDQEITVSMYGSKEAYEAVYERSVEYARGLADVLKASGNLYAIEGSDHLLFTDLGLIFGIGKVREVIGIHGSVNPERCLVISSAVVSTFFDRHLGNAKVSLDSLLQSYPELKNVQLH